MAEYRLIHRMMYLLGLMGSLTILPLLWWSVVQLNMMSLTIYHSLQPIFLECPPFLMLNNTGYLFGLWYLTMQHDDLLRHITLIFLYIFALNAHLGSKCFLFT